MSDIKKVVLAYSGGLDTSTIIPWLKEDSVLPTMQALVDQETSEKDGEKKC